MAQEAQRFGPESSHVSVFLVKVAMTTFAFVRRGLHAHTAESAQKGIKCLLVQNF